MMNKLWEGCIPLVLTKGMGEMSFKDRITEDIKQAMKAKDMVRLETVRSIKKAILEKEVSVRPSGQEALTEAQEMEILVQLAKQRRDSITQYQQAGRDDLVALETQELAILEEYLPKQLSDAEISQVIDDLIQQVGATSAKDLGKVMGPAMQQLKGQADGKKVQDMVKTKLSSN
jgi:uncharacterized protein YqeY